MLATVTGRFRCRRTRSLPPRSSHHGAGTGFAAIPMASFPLAANSIAPLMLLSPVSAILSRSSMTASSMTSPSPSIYSMFAQSSFVLTYTASPSVRKSSSSVPRKSLSVVTLSAPPVGPWTSPRLSAITKFLIPTTERACVRSSAWSTSVVLSLIVCRKVALHSPSLKISVEFVWDATHMTAFKAVKAALVSPPVLPHFNLGRPFRLKTDASVLHGLGHALSSGRNNPIDSGVYWSVAVVSSPTRKAGMLSSNWNASPSCGPSRSVIFPCKTARSASTPTPDPYLEQLFTGSNREPSSAMSRGETLSLPASGIMAQRSRQRLPGTLLNSRHATTSLVKTHRSTHRASTRASVLMKTARAPASVCVNYAKPQMLTTTTKHF